jgi:hypothetical protein
LGVIGGIPRMKKTKKINAWIRVRRVSGGSKAPPIVLGLSLALFLVSWNSDVLGQTGTSAPSPAELQRAEADSKASGMLGNYPQLVDITESTGIHFEHRSSPEAKFIAESMSGGVALIDYDGDGWPDIYFTNAQSVEMAQHGTKARSALFHNNHDGTFTDVTDKAGVGYPGWAMARSSGTTTTTAGPICW